jgi:anti-sigma factor RsiW
VNCSEVRGLLHAYIDAELDMANSLKVEQHLEKCSACRHDYHDYRALGAAIRDDSLYFQTPVLLQRRIQAVLRKADEPAGGARIVPWRRLSLAAALLLCALFGIWGLIQLWSRSSDQNMMVQQVLNSHMSSLMGNHLVDFTSSDENAIKPWFAGRLGFSPPVIDLRPQGFSLIGGRLDYLDHQPVAAIVYRVDTHIIDLFVWPSAQHDETGARLLNLQGYNLISWRAYGMNCWAISDLGSGELQQFVRLVQQHTDEARQVA